VIAQEVETVFPTAVITDESTGYKMVDYAVLVAPLIEGVKALHHENLRLKDENTSMRADVSELKVENQALKAKVQGMEDRLNRLLDVICNSHDRSKYCD
jgi:FtsZ-binding cell division protein ZapB